MESKPARPPRGGGEGGGGEGEGNGGKTHPIITIRFGSVDVMTLFFLLFFLFIYLFFRLSGRQKI